MWQQPSMLLTYRAPDAVGASFPKPLECLANANEVHRVPSTASTTLADLDETGNEWAWPADFQTEGAGSLLSGQATAFSVLWRPQYFGT
jgi:hypothetical protein